MEKDDSSDVPLPSFTGYQPPLNVSLMDDDEIGEETTRFSGGFTSMDVSTVDSIALPTMTPTPTFASPTIYTGTHKSTQSSSRGGWLLLDAPTLPEFHPLERSAVFVPESSARAIAQRISLVLEERSIHAEFNGNEAECLTQDNVEFSVFLYRGKKQYSHGVIAEVQRLSSGSMSFFEDMQAILDAAEDSERPKKKMKPPLPVVEDEDDEVASTSLAFVRKMLDNHAQQLALETLSIMLSAEKIGAKTATMASREFLSSELYPMVVEMVDDKRFAVQAMICLANAGADLPKELLVRLLRGSNTQIAYLAAKCIKAADDAEIVGALYKAQQRTGHKALNILTTKLIGGAAL